MSHQLAIPSLFEALRHEAFQVILKKSLFLPHQSKRTFYFLFFGPLCYVKDLRLRIFLNLNRWQFL